MENKDGTFGVDEETLAGILKDVPNNTTGDSAPEKQEKASKDTISAFSVTPEEGFIGKHSILFDHTLISKMDGDIKFRCGNAMALSAPSKGLPKSESDKAKYMDFVMEKVGGEERGIAITKAWVEEVNKSILAIVDPVADAEDSKEAEKDGKIYYAMMTKTEERITRLTPSAGRGRTNTLTTYFPDGKDDDKATATIKKEEERGKNLKNLEAFFKANGVVAVEAGKNIEVGDFILEGNFDIYSLFRPGGGEDPEFWTTDVVRDVKKVVLSMKQNPESPWNVVRYWTDTSNYGNDMKIAQIMKIEETGDGASAMSGGGEPEARSADDWKQDIQEIGDGNYKKIGNLRTTENQYVDINGLLLKQLPAFLQSNINDLRDDRNIIRKLKSHISDMLEDEKYSGAGRIDKAYQLIFYNDLWETQKFGGYNIDIAGEAGAEGPYKVFYDGKVDENGNILGAAGKAFKNFIEQSIKDVDILFLCESVELGENIRK